MSFWKWLITFCCTIVIFTGAEDIETVIEPPTNPPAITQETTNQGDIPEETVSTSDATSKPQETPTENITSPETTPVETEPPHVHSYISDIKVATCTAGGFTVYTCNCGDQYTDNYTEALGHQYSEWVITVKPDFWKPGKQQRTCQRCSIHEVRNTETRKINGDHNILIKTPCDITTYMVAPQESDFGQYYENAVKLYEALLMNSSEELGLFFSAESYEEEYAQWTDFQNTFEDKVLQGACYVVKRSFSTGAFPEGAGLTRINIVPSDTVRLHELCYTTVQEIALRDGMSQLEAVKQINEWMRKNFVYELGYYEPITCIESGKAQCAGYAKVFMAICKYIGIDAQYVTGCAGHQSGPCEWACHAWNRVKLGENWYYIDVCWNDASTPNRFFLTQDLWSGRTVHKSIKNL